MHYALWSIILGVFAALALVFGALAGMFWKVRSSITGAMAAFGAGALLAALSIELVAPTMMAAVESPGTAEHPFGEPFILIFGCLLGGIIFIVLDQIIDKHGGYLRKTATTISYMSRRKRARNRKLLAHLSKSEFIRSIPPDHAQHLVDFVRPVEFEAGEILFEEGSVGDRMYIVEEGRIHLTRGNEELGQVKDGDILGEIAVITGAPRTAQAVALSRVKAVEITRRDFQHLRRFMPELEGIVTELAEQRLEELGLHEAASHDAALAWATEAAGALRHGRQVPTPAELKHEAAGQSDAPMAIYLGMFLDGVPESFVLGTSFLAILTEKSLHGVPTFGQIIPYTFLAGLFLSNFPEAMSSSAGMRAQGWKLARIMTLFTILTVVSAIMTWAGYVVGTDVGPLTETLIEGISAGAMLTMIAQTMIPEAVHLAGGEIVGLCTLVGFLSATGFKLLEG